MKKKILILFLWFGVARTQGNFVFSQNSGGGYNPLGVVVDSRLFYRSDLSRGPNVLWEGTKAEFGIQNEWTPADNLISARVCLIPISFLEVAAKVGYHRMFDGLGFGCLPLSSSSGDYSAAATKSIDRIDSDGLWVQVSPTLRLKFVGLYLVNGISINYLHEDLDSYYLEVRSNLVHASEDSDFLNNFYALYEIGPRALAGLSHALTKVGTAGGRSQRVTAMVVITPEMPFVQKPFLVATGGVYTEDPMNAGRAYVGLMVGGEWKLGR